MSPAEHKLSAPTAVPGDFRPQADALVAQMSIEEQALLLSGDGWWQTHGIARLGLAPMVVSDGPHGLRKVVGAGLDGSVPATCFPTAPGLAATWNTELAREVGAALGREAQASGVHIVLGPGINMKRSPLGGRNFEYFSEDPVLAGRMAAAYIQGVQGQGVGTSLKHFAVNNQEFERMSTSSDVDERTLHEIYLQAFEIAIADAGPAAKPWSVMSAYNLVNGVQASEHRELLTTILRERWGYDGFVVSDWGGIRDRVAGVIAGNNLEMPGSGAHNRQKIIDAVRDGGLDPAVLQRVCAELVAVMLMAHAQHRPGSTFDVDAHHALSRRVGAEGIVLLKNEDRLLPLAAGTRVAVIGDFAKAPRYQGAGSSQVNPTRVAYPHDELVALLGPDQVRHARGCDEEGVTTDALLAEALAVAGEADVVLVFAGLPDSYESEGFDRRHIDLPPGQDRLIEALAAAHPKVVVVLLNGSAVAMPWVDSVGAIVEGWLGGQAGGGALADVLTGRVNPSGKLSETFPVSLQQTPAWPSFPGRDGTAWYGEGLFIGYRHYDKRSLQPLFPFGHGLSYTRFDYTAIHAEAGRFDVDGGGELVIEATLENTGELAGQEVVQLYVRERAPHVVRPERELRAFAKVSLDAGASTTVRFALGRRDFAHYDIGLHDWAVTPGTFDIQIGGSSRELPLVATVEIVSSRARRQPLTRRSMVQDFLGRPGGQAAYEEMLRALGLGGLVDPVDEAALARLSPEQLAAKRKGDRGALAFGNEMPLYKIPAMSGGVCSDARIDELLRAFAD
ncbi:beta-glucosidase family protein [Sphaerotilus mobilis]|uniref:Beta-D-glucoside glucohydrolase n=1 Tax=Sphaerotilus mobilis TaxID=47994 RepID=A0A4Q7LTV0_9BURK|nr:glycoside hydrolase family 3 C-terminal domain-containing protein [Sphaerotilus mobilis]RZS58515.1 beta-glucosidase [Sphaerotilus mobilis]